MLELNNWRIGEHRCAQGVYILDLIEPKGECAGAGGHFIEVVAVSSVKCTTSGGDLGLEGLIGR